MVGVERNPGRSRAPYGEHDDNQIQGRGWHQGHDFSGTKALSAQKACRAVNHGRKPGIGDILFRRIRMPGWTDFQGHGFEAGVDAAHKPAPDIPKCMGLFRSGNDGFMTAEGKRKNFGVTQQHAQGGSGIGCQLFRHDGQGPAGGLCGLKGKNIRGIGQVEGVSFRPGLDKQLHIQVGRV